MDRDGFWFSLVPSIDQRSPFFQGRRSSVGSSPMLQQSCYVGAVLAFSSAALHELARGGVLIPIQLAQPLANPKLFVRIGSSPIKGSSVCQWPKRFPLSHAMLGWQCPDCDRPSNPQPQTCWPDSPVQAARLITFWSRHRLRVDAICLARCLHARRVWGCIRLGPPVVPFCQLF